MGEAWIADRVDREMEVARNNSDIISSAIARHMTWWYDEPSALTSRLTTRNGFDIRW